MKNEVIKILAQKRFYVPGVKIQADRIVPIYWDPKAALSDPVVLKAVAQEFARIIRNIRPKIEVIAGGATGGISLAAATALETKLPWVYIRKKTKGYSTDSLIEGAYSKGARAVLVDDVIATGASKEIFIKNVKGKLNIQEVLVILDDTGGKYPGWISKRKIKFEALFNKKNRDHYFRKIGFFSEIAWALEQAYEADRDNWHKDKNIWKNFLDWKKGFEKTRKL
ncbi:MAG: phosphoribosyltransferase family protein [Patescibacteria group bacterium]|jgi:orotate phosphoribosyltransferase